MRDVKVQGAAAGDEPVNLRWGGREVNWVVSTMATASRKSRTRQTHDFPKPLVRRVCLVRGRRDVGTRDPMGDACWQQTRGSGNAGRETRRGDTYRAHGLARSHRTVFVASAEHGAVHPLGNNTSNLLIVSNVDCAILHVLPWLLILLLLDLRH